MRTNTFLTVFSIFIFLYFCSCRTDFSEKDIIASNKVDLEKDSLIWDSTLFTLENQVYEPSDTSIANQLISEAEDLRKKGEANEAIKFATKAKEIYLQVYDSTSIKLATSWSSIGHSNFSMNDLKSAIDAFDKAYQIISRIDESHPNNVKNLNNIATAYLKERNYKKAQQALEKALTILDNQEEKSSSLATNIHVTFGNLYLSTRNYKNAAIHFEKALEFGDDFPVKKGRALSNLGIVYFQMEAFEKAIQCWEETLVIGQNNFSDFSEIIPGVYVNLGMVYYRIGEIQKAIDYGEKGVKELLISPTRYQPNMISAYVNLASAYNGKGEYNKAIEYMLNAMALAEKYIGEKHPYVIKIYHNIGTCYYQKGDDDLAMDYFLRSKNLAIELGGDRYPDLVSIYDYIALIHGVNKDYNKAIAYQKKALDISIEQFGNNTLSTAQIYSTLGLNHSFIKDYNKAEEYIFKSLKIRQSILGEKTFEVARTYFLLGEHFLKKKDYQKAHLYTDKALNALDYNGRDFLEYVSSNTLLVPVLDHKLKIYLNQYEEQNNIVFLKKAQKIGQEALSVIDNKSKYFNPFSESSFAQQFHRVFESNLTINYGLNEKEENLNYLLEGFRLAERAKASLISSALNETNALNFSNVPDTLIERENKYRSDITYEIGKRKAILEKGILKSDTAILNISNKIFTLSRNYEQFVEYLNKEYPGYYKAKYDLSTIAIEEIQNKLLKPNQVLLEYFSGDSSIFIFAIRPDTFQVIKINLDFPIQDWVNQMRNGIYEPFTKNVKITPATKEYTEAALNIYQKLFLPVEDMIPEQSEVIIIPDGNLAYVPFDALLSQQPDDLDDFSHFPFLIKKYQFSYAQSATLLWEMRNKKHKRNPSKKLLAVAPEFSSDSTNNQFLASRYIDTSQAGYKLSRLDFNIPEVRAIHSVIGGDTLTGSNATESRFKEIAADYQILHLSTHGKVNDKSGDYSFLAFYELKDSIENEWLYNRELYNLQLNTDMVVLSACETGLGKILWGEGIASLARGFSYAGAKSIITTLWSINDQQTPELMKSFYQNLKTGMTKDAALRQAKLNFLSTSKPEPYYWAAFIPIGDMEAIDFDDGFGWWIWVVGGVLFLFGFGFLWFKKQLK